MFNMQRAAFVIFCLGVLSLSIARGDDAEVPAATLDEILNWLPPDSESLLVANGPFQIPHEIQHDASVLSSVQHFTFHLLTQISDGQLLDPLSEANVVLAVEGSRRFTSPNNLGLMPYEGCQIIVFDAASHAAIETTVELAISDAERTIEIGDITAAVFTKTLENDEWMFFVAQARPGVLLCATNQDYIDILIARMNEEHSDLAFPETFPEWEHINQDSPIWGMRHYRTEYAQDDPSSPLRPPAPANVPDDQAKGFAFWFDAESDTAIARYLTDSPRGGGIAARTWYYQPDLTPTITEIEPGVIEIQAKPNSERDSKTLLLLVLLGCLGHGIYI